MKEEKGIYLGISNKTRPIIVEHNKIGKIGEGMSFSVIHNLLNDMENENSIIIDPKNDF